MMRSGNRHGMAAVAVLAPVLWAGMDAGAATEVDLQSAVFRAKPAVVMIAVEVAAVATVRCGAGRAKTVRPAPLGRVGSGFIIHPDGWVVTNGHVVQLFHERNETSLAQALLERAVEEGCGPALRGLAGKARRQRLRAMAADQSNGGGVEIKKSLHVSLSNGRMYSAEIKVYSPPAFVEVGTTRDATGATRKEFGKDVAILKIPARDLPVVRLADRSTGLHLGQALFVIGFPGVVLDHDLLSVASRFEPSVTVGRVSGFKQDLGGQRVIQTDAAITQGNSGGPAFDDRGNVIGAATFISLKGNQMVQGFNFLVPVETIREGAGRAGVAPQPESAFTRLWNRGVELYLADKHVRALNHMKAASDLHPGFPDVERVKEDCSAKYREQPYLHREGVQWVVMGVGTLAAVVSLWFGGRLAAAARRRRLQQMIREELLASGPPRG